MYEKYDKAVAAYLRNMEVNGLSENSIAGYRRTFRFFRESMEAHDYSEPCPGAVMQFKFDHAESAITTLNLYLQHMMYLSDFGARMGFWDKPFVAQEDFPPRKKVAKARQKPYTHALSREDMYLLINAEKPSQGRKTATWLREKAIVTLLLQSGLRNSELRAITPADLDWENGVLYASVTKGDKPRYVAFNKTAQNAVKVYLDSGFRPAYVSDSEPLFGVLDELTGGWKPFERRQLSEQIYKYSSKVLGEDKAFRSHAARHGYASAALSCGVGIDEIGETLGHADLRTTRIYAERLNPHEVSFDVGSVLDNAFARAM